MESVNSHHGFADWLNRRLDTATKLETETNAIIDPFVPRRAFDRVMTPTVYNATLGAIADLRRGTKVHGVGNIKMIVTGHSCVSLAHLLIHDKPLMHSGSLGGAVASLFSLRLSAAGHWDISDSYDLNCLERDPDGGQFDRAEGHVLPVKQALAVTFGAPRFLWHGDDKEYAHFVYPHILTLKLITNTLEDLRRRN